MPAADGTITIALDFDGTMVEDHQLPFQWRPKAKEFVLGAAAAGVKVALWSCRCAIAGGLAEGGPWDADDFWRSGRTPEDLAKSWQLFEEMRSFLVAEGVWNLLHPWTLPGKPFADAYIDDKAEPPDFYRLAGELGIHLAHGFPSGSGPTLQVGGGPPAAVPSPSVDAGAPAGTGTPAPGVRLGS